LIQFDGKNTFFMEVCTYETKEFKCNINLKYNYEEEETTYMFEGESEE
jgi:hypothetical protein